MIVVCINEKIDSSPLVLPINPNEKLSEDNYVCTVYCSDTVGVTIKPCEQYRAHAILIYDAIVYYLIDNGVDGICFLPSELFEVSDNTMEYDWRFFEYQVIKSSLVAIGPSVLVGEYKNIIDIIKHSSEMTRRYLERKRYLSEWGISPFSE